MLNNNNQIEDNNSENVEESISEEENEDGVYPLINLNISLNNGQRKSLIIYEKDNIEQKVKDFCLTNRISPDDEEALLQRVKEELDTKSSKSKTGSFKHDSLSSKKIINEPKDIQIMNNKFLDYLPEEKTRLDHILNESDSVSVSESLKQTNNLDNLIKEYKSDKVDEAVKDNNMMLNNIIDQARKQNTIKKDLNKNVNPYLHNNLNNNKQPILFSNVNLINSAKPNNNLNNISKPAIIKPVYTNINNNINQIAIPKKEANKYNSFYINNNNNNKILFNKSGLNITQLNNTYQNINNTNSNILPLNKSNYTKGNINSFTGLVNPKVEFLDTYNSNNYTNNIILSPQPQTKTVIYNAAPCENYVNYNQVESPKIETITTYNETLTLPNNIEPYKYTYETNEISSLQSNPNIYNFNTNTTEVYNQNNKLNKNESIVYDYSQTQYTDINNINSTNIITDINNPQNVNINYDNLNSQKNINYDLLSNQNTQTDKYDTVNQTDFTTYENFNFQTFSSNYDTTNNQVQEYSNEEIVNSPNLDTEYKIYDALNKQIVEYEDSPKIFTNENSQYQIYENVQSQKSLMNNNNINDLNIQNDGKSKKNKNVKVLKVENYNYDLIQNNNNLPNQLADINNINDNIIHNSNYSNKNFDKKENPFLNQNIIMNENIINNNNLNALNNNLNKIPTLNNSQTNNKNYLNNNIKNVAYNHKNNNLKNIELLQNKVFTNDTKEISQLRSILDSEMQDSERKENNKEINTTIEIESENNKNLHVSSKNNSLNNKIQIVEMNSVSYEDEINESVHPLDSPTRKKEQKKYNNLYDSNMIEEDISNENKKSNKESIYNSKKNENNIKNNEENEDSVEEKGPQDNCQKKKKVDLPRDTDENQTQTQYDNISDNSKHNRSNISNLESNISKINISEININKSKNSNIKNSSKISDNNKINSYNTYYNKIINDEDINNSINNKNKNEQKNNAIKDLFDNLSQNDKKEEENNKSNKKLYNNIINIKKDNGSENINESSIGNENFENYLDKELGNKKPKYKKIINLENSLTSSQSQSLQNSQINDNYSKYTYQQKNNNRKKPMKVLTFKNNEFNPNNINKRSNSSGVNRNKCNMSKINLSSERLYEDYKNQLQRKEMLKKRILEERELDENRNISPTPRIDPNSRRIVEKMRNNKRENKIEERLINYGYNKKQKHLIEKANNDIKNKIKNPFKPKIDKKSRAIANRNKQNRISKSIDIIEEKKKRINYKKIDLNKEFGKRNRSIGNEYSKKNGLINFENSKNNNNSYLSRNNKNPFKRNSNATNENNYNLNSYRNSKNENNTSTDENKATTLSQLNKTLELNTAYKELYNSIDEKMDSDITKYFGNYGTDLNSNLTENNIYSHHKLNSKENNHSADTKNKNIQKEKRSLTPPVYNTFDYLYYESEQQDEKIRKKQELHFKRYYPFKPRISPYAKQLKNKKKESTSQFINRISKNLEEIKAVNKSKTKTDMNNKNTFRPKVSRGPKNPNQRNVTVNLDGFYDKRLTEEKNNLQKIKKEEDKEKKILYNQKSKDIIMKMKIQKYKEIFNLLDSNKDGFISSDEIQLTKIDERFLKNISPLLEDLNKTKKRMNFKEFCIKIDKLMIEKKLEKNK